MFESFRKFACKSCYHVGRPKLWLPGSVVAEVILWLFMILPGLIYTLWRRSTTKWACAECGSFEIIGAGTPLGKKIVSEMAIKVEPKAA